MVQRIIGTPTRLDGVTQRIINAERLRASQFRSEAQRKKSEEANQTDVLGVEHVLKGRSQLQGAGEATISITFPVTFIEPPILTASYTLAEGSVLEAGQFPIASIGVAAWGPNGEGPEMPDATDGQNYSLRTYYTGAMLACVVTGPSVQNAYVNWVFMGIAITNPYTSGLDLVPQLGTVGVGELVI